MRGWIAATTAVALLALAGPAAAQALELETGESLLGRCKSGSEGALTCLGYVSGVADAMAAGNSINLATACFVGKVNAGQLQDAVVAWLERNADKRHFAAAGLVAAALAETFPCPR